MEDRIVYPELNEYLHSLLPESEGLLKELETLAKEPYIPIIQKEVAQFLKVMFSYNPPHKLLEIGTAIGYSAIYFLSIMASDGKVTTIERNEDMINAAKDNFLKAGVTQKVTLLEGDATEILPKLEGEYDVIFLDAAKGQYMNFLPNIMRLLKPGGTLITDNILYRGIVASEELAPKKHITIARNLRKYLHEITHNPALETTVIPLGDGVGISRKIK